MVSPVNRDEAGEDPEKRAIRDEYVEFGPEEYYAEWGSEYRNPHEDSLRSAIAQAHQQWALDLTKVLDLACGSGEATLELQELGATEIEGADPYTGDAYFQRTGEHALPLTFEQIATGELAERTYTLIVCSYALHLLEPSRLPALLWRLAESAPQLLILSPHKRPVIPRDCGWRLDGEIYHQRVRVRLLGRRP